MVMIAPPCLERQLCKCCYEDGDKLVPAGRRARAPMLDSLGIRIRLMLCIGLPYIEIPYQESQQAPISVASAFHQRNSRCSTPGSSCRSNALKRRQRQP